MEEETRHHKKFGKTATKLQTSGQDNRRETLTVHMSKRAHGEQLRTIREICGHIKTKL